MEILRARGRAEAGRGETIRLCPLWRRSLRFSQVLSGSLRLSDLSCLSSLSRIATGGSDASSGGVPRASATAHAQMGFRVLDLQSPVSQAVTNSAKRVVVLFASVMFLGETVSRRKIIGSSIAMAGVLAYSLAKVSADASAKRAKDTKKKA